MKSKFLNYNIGRCLLVKDTRLIYTKEVEWKYPTVRKVSSFYYLCVWKRSVLFIKTNKITCKSKNHKKILWTIIYQQTGQPRRNGQVSKNIQPTNTE